MKTTPTINAGVAAENVPTHPNGNNRTEFTKIMVYFHKIDIERCMEMIEQNGTKTQFDLITMHNTRNNALREMKYKNFQANFVVSQVKRRIATHTHTHNHKRGVFV